jgi:hypothetical protein
MIGKDVMSAALTHSSEIVSIAKLKDAHRSLGGEKYRNLLHNLYTRRRGDQREEKRTRSLLTVPRKEKPI